MPVDSAKTREDILQSAKTEFLQHGFAGASLRIIAANAGVTTGALYRHFEGKDALFEALVSPAYKGLLDSFREMTEEYIQMLESGGLDAMWEKNADNISWYVDYFYDNFDVFKLLLSASEQTTYENFVHTLIDLDMELSLRYFAEARCKGYSVRELDHQEMHMLVNGQFSSLFELILRDVPRERAKRYARTVARFSQAGWREILAPAGE